MSAPRHEALGTQRRSHSKAGEGAVSRSGTRRSQTPDGDFQRQKRLFQRIRREELDQYSGRYVACREGQIVDSDAELPALTARFFSQYGHVPVYVTRVDPQSMVAAIDTPFFD